MAKRSNFPKRKHDAYMTTDPRAVKALLPYLGNVRKFLEPCAGDGDLIRALETAGIQCSGSNDIRWLDGVDAMTLDCMSDADAIITNPPWTREILHPMIVHFCSQLPTWLLFDQDWAATVQAKPYLTMCTDIVAIGRLKWLKDSKHQAKDNCCWYRFDAHHAGPTLFHGKQ